jgi:glycosyltransferase involved in cell wall biosynthesis
VSNEFISNVGESEIRAYLDALARVREPGEPESLIRLRSKELCWTISRLLGRIERALSLSGKAEERPEETGKKVAPSWAPAAGPNPARAPIERPRLLFDMTSTLRSGKNTGIQRVVRETARNGWMMGEGIPVAIHEGELLPYYLSPDFPGAVEIEEGDVFLMIDATWNHIDEYLPIIERVKARGGSTLVGLHDILPLRYPSAFPPPLVQCVRDWMEKVVLSSDGVIAVSRVAAESLRDYLMESGLRRPGFSIGWWRPGDDFSLSCDAEASALAQRITQASRPYFLGVGTVEPRKGYPLVLDTLEKLWAEGKDTSYVIVGGVGWGMRQFERRIEDHPELGRRLFWFRNASDADLALLYRHTRAMVLASVAEGFGLPIVEAARYGAPVIASDIPVFRETAGDDALYFRLLDRDSLTEKMRQALLVKPSAPALESVSWRESAAQLFRMARGGAFQMRLGVEATSRKAAAVTSPKALPDRPRRAQNG